MTPCTTLRHMVRRHWTFVTVVCALLCIVHAAGAQTPPGDVSFDAIYRRGSEINADLKTLTARFVETTASSLLVQPLKSSGLVAVERPSKIVLHYEQPEPRTMLIEGDRLTMSWPGRNLREVTNISAANRRIQRYFVEGDADTLRESFTIATERAADRAGTYKLTMVPRRSQIREGLTQLELWLEQTSLLMTAMRMTFPNGDTKLMEFEDVRVNVPIDPGLFSLGEAPPRQR